MKKVLIAGINVAKVTELTKPIVIIDPQMLNFAKKAAEDGVALLHEVDDVYLFQGRRLKEEAETVIIIKEIELDIVPEVGDEIFVNGSYFSIERKIYNEDNSITLVIYTKQLEPADIKVHETSETFKEVMNVYNDYIANTSKLTRFFRRIYIKN